MRNGLLALMVLILGHSTMQAAVKTEVIEYPVNGTKMKGFLAYDDQAKGKRPGVMVVHEWWGLNDYARKRAEMLAELGYVAFAVDMYGEGKTTEHPKEAGEMAGMVRKNGEVWLGRAKAGLDVLKNDPRVDPTKLAVIGYCFGGSTALKLAQSGTDLRAAVSFHGALPVPSDAEAKSIKGRVLVCHGADDSFIPAEVIKQFRAAYDGAGVKYEFVAYPGAQHSFTVPDADSRKLNGIKYDEKADKASWKAMSDLFADVFAK